MATTRSAESSTASPKYRHAPVHHYHRTSERTTRTPLGSCVEAENRSSVAGSAEDGADGRAHPRRRRLGVGRVEEPRRAMARLDPAWIHPAKLREGD
jgi:hypothetical protein